MFSVNTPYIRGRRRRLQVVPITPAFIQPVILPVFQQQSPQPRIPLLPRPQPEDFVDDNESRAGRRSVSGYASNKRSPSPPRGRQRNRRRDSSQRRSVSRTIADEHSRSPSYERRSERERSLTPLSPPPPSRERNEGLVGELVREGARALVRYVGAGNYGRQRSPSLSPSLSRDRRRPDDNYKERPRMRERYRSETKIRIYPEKKRG